MTKDTTNHAEESSPEDEVAFSTAADLGKVISKTKWLWRDWLPVGFVCALVGESGVGKSSVGLALMQKVLSPGQAWPDGQAGSKEAGQIVWLDTEASQALLYERVKKWGLPADKILLPFRNPLDSGDLSDFETRDQLLAFVKKHKPAAVVIDSLQGAHSGEENSTKEMTVVMKFLGELARDGETAVIVIHHLRKKNLVDGRDIDLGRVRGSTAIPSFARVVLGLEPMASNLRLRVIKSNLSRKPKAVGAAIGDKGVTFGDAPTVPQRYKPEDWLKQQLASGPKPLADLLAAAKFVRISRNKLYAAGTALWVVSKKEGGKKTVRWSLPRKNGEKDASG